MSVERPFFPLLLAAVFASCATAGPREAVRAYRDAVARKDWVTVREMSDGATRAAFSVEDLAAAAATDTEEHQATLSRLDALAGAPQRVEIRGPGQPGVVLVEEPDGWRVVEGGLALPWDATPSRALATFFWAVGTERLDVVRRLIPRRAAARFAGDAALRSHLAAESTRIDAARRALGDDLRGRFTVQGTEARLGYGPGRTVRLISEDGRWRVVDLE